MKYQTVNYRIQRAAYAIPSVVAVAVAGFLFTALLPSVMAQASSYSYVNTTGLTKEAGTEDVPFGRTGGDSYAAVHVNGTAGGVVYEGTWLTLAGDPVATSWANNGMAARVTAGGELRLYNSTLSTSGVTGGQIGIRADGASIVHVEKSNISTSSQGGGQYGIYTSAGVSLTLIDTDITTFADGAYGVVTQGSASTVATASITGGMVETGGTSAHALLFENSNATVQGVSLITHGKSARGVSANGAQGRVELSTGVTIATEGERAPGIWVEVGGTLIADHITVSTSGAAAHGIGLGWQSHADGTKVTVTDSTVKVTGPDSAALTIGGDKGDGDYTLEVTGGTYTSAQGAGLLLNRDVSNFSTTEPANYEVSINSAQVKGQHAIQVSKSAGSPLLEATIVVGSNSELVGDVSFGETSKTTLTLTGGTTLTGNVYESGSAQASILLESGSVLTGNVNKSGDNQNQKLDLGITGSTWTSTGSSTVDDLTLDGATLNLTLADLTDAITVGGTLNVVTGSQSTVFVDLGNDLLSEILGEPGDGTAVINVFSLITGSASFVGDGDNDKWLNYTVLEENAAGSTYTVQYQGDGNYKIGNIMLAAVPEPATCATLAGLTLLVYAISRTRSSRR
ncbi:MAG: hypothetical protein LBK99_10960 [Opitutaceae bacterium]|jgi:hypothetical protein|nr:hypothetical protein [Opitutaceae bacterium]